MVRTPRNSAGERGTTLVEILIALIVLSIGLIAVAQMFPSGSRAQVQDHLLTGANNYAQQTIEDLQTRTWADTALTDGRHPSATTSLTLGTYNEWSLFYNVTTLAAPLDNLKRVDVTVSYHGAGLSSSRSVVATTYIRR